MNDIPVVFVKFSSIYEALAITGNGTSFSDFVRKFFSYLLLK